MFHVNTFIGYCKVNAQINFTPSEDNLIIFGFVCFLLSCGSSSICLILKFFSCHHLEVFISSDDVIEFAHNAEIRSCRSTCSYKNSFT